MNAWRSVPFFALLTALHFSTTATGEEQSFQLNCSDGFALDGKISLPENMTADQVKRVIVLIHGSGNHSMDQDLTVVTKQRKKNLFFLELSRSLTDAGFAVVRYNKRGYQLLLKLGQDPAFRESQIVKASNANPLKLYVEDARDCARFAANKFPMAKLFLLGHSQGTYVSLQVARQTPAVKGVGLIGFAQWSTEVLVFEQTVYRALGTFDQLDQNRDDLLDADELKAEAAAGLRSQLALLDLDHNQAISRTELKAGSLSNLMSTDIFGAFRKQEAEYPRSSDILRSAKFKVLFFQGLWDNQTPAYHAKAVELLNRNVWKKDNLHFHYFPGLGHALDKRSSYYDLEFDTIAPDALETLTREMDRTF
jgi:pimeloyl-ACP methyl ester carboxylesterase